MQKLTSLRGPVWGGQVVHHSLAEKRRMVDTGSASQRGKSCGEKSSS